MEIYRNELLLISKRCQQFFCREKGRHFQIFLIAVDINSFKTHDLCSLVNMAISHCFKSGNNYTYEDIDAC